MITTRLAAYRWYGISGLLSRAMSSGWGYCCLLLYYRFWDGLISPSASYVS